MIPSYSIHFIPSQPTVNQDRTLLVKYSALGNLPNGLPVSFLADHLLLQLLVDATAVYSVVLDPTMSTNLISIIYNCYLVNLDINILRTTEPTTYLEVYFITVKNYKQ